MILSGAPVAVDPGVRLIKRRSTLLHGVLGPTALSLVRKGPGTDGQDLSAHISVTAE